MHIWIWILIMNATYSTESTHHRNLINFCVANANSNFKNYYTIWNGTSNSKEWWGETLNCLRSKKPHNDSSSSTKFQQLARTLLQSWHTWKRTGQIFEFVPYSSIFIRLNSREVLFVTWGCKRSGIWGNGTPPQANLLISNQGMYKLSRGQSSSIFITAKFNHPLSETLPDYDKVIRLHRTLCYSHLRYQLLLFILLLIIQC